MKPTSQLYTLLQSSYDHFNSSLFDDKLPNIMFTVQRVSGVMGYFAPDRWQSKKGEKCHEIAINPEYVARYSIIELMQTLVHEMVHCWQHCFGKPSIRTYHNTQWSKKMESIGLIPSSTGLPNGKKTGQKMSDYPEPKGKFIKECQALIKKDSFNINWIDSNAKLSSVSDSERMDIIKEALADLEDENLASQLISEVGNFFQNIHTINFDDSKKRQKTKYTCKSCNINVWGKPDLNILCGDCDIPLIEY